MAALSATQGIAAPVRVKPTAAGSSLALLGFSAPCFRIARLLTRQLDLVFPNRVSSGGDLGTIAGLCSEWARHGAP